MASFAPSRPFLVIPLPGDCLCTKPNSSFHPKLSLRSANEPLRFSAPSTSNADKDGEYSGVHDDEGKQPLEHYDKGIMTSAQ